MSNQNDQHTQSFQALARNLQAYVDERAGVNVDQNLESKIDALLKSKLGAALLAAPSFQAPTLPAVSAVSTNLVARAEPTTSDLRNLKGMCPKTGTLLSGIHYLKSRLDDAVHTPKRSQVLLRARGSDISDLIDSPQNQQGGLAVMAAYAQAIADPLSGVPDFVLTRIKFLTSDLSGKLEVLLSGKWLGSDVEITV